MAISVNYSGHVIANWYCEDDGEFEDKYNHIKQWKVCPYCTQPIKENKEYEEWETNEAIKQIKKEAKRHKEQFIEQHKGHEEHVWKLSIPVFGQEHGTNRIVGPYYSKKECIYCYDIVEES